MPALIMNFDCLKTSAYTGNATKAIIEANDTILESKNTSSQVKSKRPSIALKPGIVKANPIRAPKDEATPLPPLKFRNTVQLWPQMQQKPINKRICSFVRKVILGPKIFPKKITGIAPLRISRIRIVTPQPFPNTRKAFVAPTFPEPTVRTSTPFKRRQNM